MDAVILYVDNTDPIWQSQLKEVLVNTPSTYDKFITSKRYCYWGLLETQFKLVRTNMPFIKNMFLVCSGKSQVPDFCEKYDVIPVLHEDIIPASHLPTFNSSTIELFIQNITQLDEQFVYFNDDMFPIRKCQEDDFFVDKKPALQFRLKVKASNTWRKCVQNSWILANSAVGEQLSPNCSYLLPQHSAYPMLKSDCIDFYNKFKSELLLKSTKFRFSFNYTVYTYLFYSYLLGHVAQKPHSFNYCGIWEIPLDSDLLQLFSSKIVCFNDVGERNDNFEIRKERIKTMLERTIQNDTYN